MQACQRTRILTDTVQPVGLLQDAVSTHCALLHPLCQGLASHSHLQGDAPRCLPTPACSLRATEMVSLMIHHSLIFLG